MCAPKALDDEVSFGGEPSQVDHWRIMRRDSKLTFIVWYKDRTQEEPIMIDTLGLVDSDFNRIDM